MIVSWSWSPGNTMAPSPPARGPTTLSRSVAPHVTGRGGGGHVNTPSCTRHAPGDDALEAPHEQL